ncbi:conserved hypothetical protein [Candidatus Desulfosporosinus infrequens]|uniref:SpoVT-AbrB domain-containing protein n=1 Tax=Candidatus Desulfosporosinus infrequens TaxID=2043169 RepID=A0A2U3LH27_9FIRM|nr:conserved hypothetical protein [Candidatus Desulfosporosinus infrequens]
MTNKQLGKSFGIVQMKRRSSITIGKEVRKALNLADEGDVFEMIVEDGRIILEPKKLVPADQAWYWSEEWQAGEREAREDIASGRVIRARSVEELMEKLNSGDEGGV